MSALINVIVVRDWAEASNLGARSVGGVVELDGYRVVTANQHPSAIYGILVGEVRLSEHAADGRGFHDLWEALQLGQRKSGYRS